MRSVVVVAGLALLSSCDGLAPQCETKTSLVRGDGWAFVAPSDDTVWPAPPDAALCGAEAIQTQPLGDDLALEIDTRFGCGWATVAQPIDADLAAGDELQLRVFYFSQNTFPSAEAEVAIALDGEIIVSERVPIPTSSGLIAPRVAVPRAVARGALAQFHIGNHGDNSWNLVELSVIGQGVCPDET